MAFRSPQRWQGLGFSLINCFPEALRVGGLVCAMSCVVSGLECPRVARALPSSVACSSSAAKRFAVRALLSLIWSHLQIPSGSTLLQFETAFLLCRQDLEGHSVLFAHPRRYEQNKNKCLLLALTDALTMRSSRSCQTSEPNHGFARPVSDRVNR